MQNLLQGVQDMIEAQELIPLDSQEAEVQTEEFVEQEDWTQQDEDLFNGEEAGVSFAQRHITEKIIMFVQEYRRNNYSEDFVAGFLNGINGAVEGNIRLPDTESVDKSQ